MNSPEESRFDEELRRRLADFSATPASDGWPGLRDQLPPAALPKAGGRWQPFGAGLLVGGLLMVGIWQPWQEQYAGQQTAVMTQPTGVEQRVSPATGNSPAGSGAAARPTQAVAPAERVATEAVVSPARPAAATVRVTGRATSRTPVAEGPSAFWGTPSSGQTTGSPTATGTTTGVSSSALPSAAVVGSPAAQQTESTTGETPRQVQSGVWQQALALDADIRQALAATDPERPTRLRALLDAQTQVLAQLQHGVDSLKQSLPEAPPTLAGTDSTANQEVKPLQADWKTLPPTRSPWAVLLLAETTPSWSVLPTPAGTGDQEQTEASLGQSIQLQGQLKDRWRVRGGFGQTTLQTQARYTSERTGQTTHTDTTLTSQVLHQTVRDSVRIVYRDTVAIYEPILNASGQVVGYDTSWVSTNDTVWTIFIRRNTEVKTNQVVTNRTEFWRERRQQQFRPEYRFWTLPFSAQYLLVSRNRWNLGVSVGGQVTVFRGGTRPVWNGDEYVMQRIGPREGPYRPVSFSLSGGLEAQYRLTPRLNVVAAPTVRWWAVPAAKGGTTTRTLLPAAQLGVSYGF